MLKQASSGSPASVCTQPPLGGCVLKHAQFFGCGAHGFQPPLGGCVLKQAICRRRERALYSAAFRRLCVETRVNLHYLKYNLFSRL